MNIVVPTLRDIERRAIIQYLLAYDGNRTKTAAALGISIRKLREKIREYTRKGFAIEPPKRGLGKTRRML